jgi:hypothetical protein
MGDQIVLVFVGLIVIVILLVGVWLVTYDHGGNPDVEASEDMYRNAKESSDLSICPEIPHPYHKYLCYSHFAESERDLSLCDRISDSGYLHLKKTCISRVGIALNDSTICDAVPVETDSEDRDECYEKVAIATGDPPLCDKIENIGFEDDMFTSGEVEYHDIEWCKKQAAT